MKTQHSDERKKALPDEMAGASRYQEHHLPWDRFSRERPTLLLKPSIDADNPNLLNLAIETWQCFGACEK